MSNAFLSRLVLLPKLPNIKLKPEEALCTAFANRLREYTLTGRLRAIWTHIPNELAGASDRSQIHKAMIRYTKAKCQGMIPGSPDYVFLWNGGSGFLEAKAGKGRLTENQKDFQAWANSAGVDYEIFRSIEEAEGVLIKWGVLQ